MYLTHKETQFKHIYDISHKSNIFTRLWALSKEQEDPNQTGIFGFRQGDKYLCRIQH